ncbi:MFS transporter [Allorhizobium terrae]|uniref:MFS transporter n=1 Tax=Allorhizobium terrae TaxID=1848972 RepID=A0A4S3ZNT9_9HYPH|nr:MFS transporter [Allorhizobium terrae]THF47090.1 MFS transporter [Allorhizobium terrae]
MSPLPDTNEFTIPSYSRKRRWLILVAVMLAFLPVVLDMTILHIAVPSLTLALQASTTQVLWIIDIYSLLMAGLLVPMGTLADRIGYRKLLLTGLAVFGLASIVAAFSTTPTMLIGGRILLAFGASMIMPCVLGIIRLTFEDPGERAIALGLWGTVGSAGAAVGPLVGGALLEHFWWGSVFLINIPVVVLICPAIAYALPRSQRGKLGDWHLNQALMLIVGIVALVFAVKSGFSGKQSLWVALSAAIFGVVALTFFVKSQRRAVNPMLDLSLLTRRPIVVGIAMAVVTSGALAGVELTIAQELQFVLDKSPLQAGFFMLPIMVAAGVGGPIAGFLSNRFGLRRVASLSLITAAASLAALAQFDFHHHREIISALLVALGLALSIGLTASSIAIMGAVEAEKGGSGGALEAMGYELGAGLGITFFGVALSAVYASAMVVPAGIAPELADAARHSIGDTYVIAKQLSSASAASLIIAGKQAFSSAHAVLLTSAAALIAMLATAVFMALKNNNQP